MSITARQLKTLEHEMINLHASLEQLLGPQPHAISKPVKDRTKLLDLFGAWDGEVDTFLQELSVRRERRGRLE